MEIIDTKIITIPLSWSQASGTTNAYSNEQNNLLILYLNNNYRIISQIPVNTHDTGMVIYVVQKISYTENEPQGRPTVSKKPSSYYPDNY